MTLLQIAALLLALLTLVTWVNARSLMLPTSAVTLSAGVIAAVVLFAAQTAIEPFWGFNSVRQRLGDIDFTQAVLGYMLAFLLFAGGLEVDLGEFRRRQVAILSLATAGVLVSTALIGFGVWWAAHWTGVPLSLPWALAFGALISPTDPVAVIGQVRSGGLSTRLGAVLQGEALYNDGVGLVAFSAALAFVASGSVPDPLHAAWAILLEAGGGLLLGLVCGGVVLLALRGLDDYVVALTATLALALGVYALAQMLHVSGPIAAATAGLLVGSYGMDRIFDEESRGYVQRFWHVVDEVLNGLLFLLLGLQVFLISFDFGQAGLWVAAILLTLVARLLVVMPWGIWFHMHYGERGPSMLLVWGGMRGAISVALALSLPAGSEREVVLASTFAVVLFSVLAQGLTFGKLAARLSERPST